MTTEVKYFQRILKRKYPTIWDKVGISVSQESNYHQYLGMDGRMRAEINHQKPVNYDVSITFQSIDRLYYDMCFFIMFVWSPSNIISSYSYSNGSDKMTHKFEFTI